MIARPARTITRPPDRPTPAVDPPRADRLSSRLYVPRSIGKDVRDRIVAMIRDIRMGDVQDFRNFMGAVIDRKAFEGIAGCGSSALSAASRSPPR